MATAMAPTTIAQPQMMATTIAAPQQFVQQIQAPQVIQQAPLMGSVQMRPQTVQQALPTTMIGGGTQTLAAPTYGTAAYGAAPTMMGVPTTTMAAPTVI